jgi:hypothetical protein
MLMILSELFDFGVAAGVIGKLRVKTVTDRLGTIRVDPPDVGDDPPNAKLEPFNHKPAVERLFVRGNYDDAKTWVIVKIGCWSVVFGHLMKQAFWFRLEVSLSSNEFFSVHFSREMTIIQPLQLPSRRLCCQSCFERCARIDATSSEDFSVSELHNRGARSQTSFCRVARRQSVN